MLGLAVLGPLCAVQVTTVQYSTVQYSTAQYCRRQQGQPLEAGMCVVVQEMVEAEAAGVLFTADPVAGSCLQ